MVPKSLPINVAFLWHMHQPYYKDLKTGVYKMPWVRLHALKDYYDMVALLEDYPNIHQTFNLVPCLMEQIEDYAYNEVYDRHLLLTEKPAAQLSKGEREEILRTFFSASPKTMIEPYFRFHQLWKKRGESQDKVPFVIDRFSTQEFLDLQVWSNLCWIDPIFRRDKEIDYLFNKKKNYTEEDKKLLILKQREIMKSILPKYRKLQDQNQIEVTISPYFHPILPLLCDTDSAKVALPNIDLPSQRFSHPEDAQTQIEMGIKLYEKVFGRRPKGMWPSEGSVSPQILPLLAKSEIEWIATDEEILYLSETKASEEVESSKRVSPQSLHQPYKTAIDGFCLSLIFRDHKLSDLIGFVYANWDAESAASDLIEKLHKIREQIPQEKLPQSLVSIILDGENCWEYYKNDGHDFLNVLYSKLSGDELIRTVTVSEFLNQNPPQQQITKLFSGSWINHNFRIWIGHPEDNLAWDFLKKARDRLTQIEKDNSGEIDKDKLKQAWREIYIVEGSDWCWWYGDEHQGPNQEFDGLFRSHLIHLYELISLDPPKVLFEPIRTKIPLPDYVSPTGFVTPIVDGKVTHFYEWANAGFLDCLRAAGSMHRASQIIKGIYFGFDSEDLHFRIDSSIFPEEEYEFVLEILEPPRYNISIKDKTATLHQISETDNQNLPTALKLVASDINLAVLKIIEFSFPIRLLDFKSGEKEVRCRLLVKEKEKELERWPELHLIKLELPGDEKRPIFWGV